MLGNKNIFYSFKCLFKCILNFLPIILNNLQLIIFKVKNGKNLKINGLIHIRNKGTLFLGDNVTINSGLAYNQTGGQFKSSIVVSEGSILKIGNNTGISNSSIYCADKITIGDNVMIGGATRIYDTDFHSLEYNKRMTAGDSGNKKAVTIKEGAFIGAGVIVLKGSTIGRFSVVGAGSVVSGIIPDNQIWAGNPAQFVRNIQL